MWCLQATTRAIPRPISIGPAACAPRKRGPVLAGLEMPLDSPVDSFPFTHHPNQRRLPSPTRSTPSPLLSPAAEEKLLSDYGLYDNDGKMNFPGDDFEGYFCGGRSFIEEMTNAVEMMNRHSSFPPSPASEIDVVGECPEMNNEIEVKPPLPVYLQTPSHYAPYEVETHKPRGRPRKMVAETKRAQLAKNWRERKQQEELAKNELIAQQRQVIADKEIENEILKQEVSELRAGRVRAVQEMELKNQQLRVDNQNLLRRLERMFEDQELLVAQIQQSNNH